MKAVVYTEYGPPDVLRIEEIEQPTPKGHQVLVEVHAASINAGDYRVRNGRPLVIRPMLGGLRKPREPRTGSDVAGRVVAVGEEVTRFQPGDAVFGCAGGSFAEYVLAREAYLAPLPANRTFEEAAAVPVAALTALQGLRYAGAITAGQTVLIQGASGGVGTFAVQLAKASGAEVTAVCSPRNLELARTLGADHVIDYTREDFTRGAQRYDLILAVNGYHSLTAYRRALTPQGAYVCAGGTMPQIFQAILLGSLLSRGGKQLRSMGIASVNEEDLLQLAQLLESGAITPIIDRHYALDDIVEAFRYVEETHPQGKVVIVVQADDAS